MANSATDTPDKPSKLTDEELTDEVSTLVEHERADVLSENQEKRLRDLREEVTKRACTAGPYADYEGGPDDE